MRLILTFWPDFHPETMLLEYKHLHQKYTITIEFSTKKHNYFLVKTKLSQYNALIHFLHSRINPIPFFILMFTQVILICITSFSCNYLNRRVLLMFCAQIIACLCNLSFMSIISIISNFLSQILQTFMERTIKISFFPQFWVNSKHYTT